MSESIPFPLSIVRRRRQKTIRMRIKGNEIVVSAPFHCSDDMILDFVKRNQPWIEKNVSRQIGKKEALKEELQKNARAIFMDGQWVPLIYSGANSGNSDISFHYQGAMLGWFANKESPFYVDFPLIKKAANTWLKSRAKIVLVEKLEATGSRLGFTWNKVYVRSQKTKWGTCSSRKNISLNWRLIKTPDWVQEYLLIHELCHTQHLNHGKNYWNLVDFHFPRRKEAEAWLKQHEALVFADSETL